MKKLQNITSENTMFRFMRLNIEFIFLTLVLLGVNMLYFKPNFLPLGDTMANFQLYYFYYNELFFHSHLALWLPYGTFGLAASFHQFISFTPMNYLSAVIGFVLRIKDVLFLYKLSMLLEQCVLLSGIYLLCSVLSFGRVTRIVVSLGTVMSTVWYSQILFNFHIYLMFPIIAACLVLFFEKNKAEYFWLACITFLIWNMGMTTYVAFLWIFVITIFCAVIFIHKKGALRSLLHFSLYSKILISITILISAFYVYYILDSLTLLSFVSPMREANTLFVSLKTFLYYPASLDAQYLLRNIVLGLSPNPQTSSIYSDTTFYIGLAPLVFFVWGIIKVRNTYFIAFLMTAIALFWLSFGGLFARAVYLFPGMFFYRYIALVHGLVRILVLICAGYGLEAFLSLKMSDKLPFTIIGAVMFNILLDCNLSNLGQGVIEDILFREWPIIGMPFSSFFTHFDIANPSFRFGLYLFAFASALVAALVIYILENKKYFKFDRSKLDFAVKAALICLFLLDMASYQVQVYEGHLAHLRDPAAFASTTYVNKLPYQEQRKEGIFNERQINVIKTMKDHDYMGASYAPHIYLYSQLDPVVPQVRVDVMNTRIKNLAGMLGTTNLPMFGHIMGSLSPKLRLATSATAYNTRDEAMKAIEKLTDYNTVIFGGTQIDKISDNVRSGNKLDEGYIKINEFDANALDLEADVSDDNGAWLVYSDAFHPTWHAYVNHVEVPIYAAYTALKAVHLDKGLNQVHFKIKNSLCYLMAFLGLFYGIALTSLFILCFISTPRPVTKDSGDTILI